MKTNFSSLRLRLGFLLLCLTTGSVSALPVQQSVVVSSTVDKSKIAIGDLITYSVEVTHDPAVQVEMPELGVHLGAFEIRDYSDQEPVNSKGKVIHRVSYIISTFDVGEFEIPPVAIYYHLPDDSTRHEIKTQKIGITVESMKPSEAGDIRDIKGPLGLPGSYRNIIIWGSLALALLALLGISYYIWHRRRAGKGILPQKVEPPRPAHEIALQELDKLKASSLLQEGKFKQYYIEMSDIIRRYIEGRYFIVALELTTTDLLDDLKTSDVEGKNIELIHEFLSVCDMVKFAKYKPGKSENEQNLNKAYDLVEQTKLIYDVSFEQENGETEASPQAPEPENFGVKTQVSK